MLTCRTTKLFAAAGLRESQVERSDANGVWDQKLEDELKNIASPKLAIPKADGSIRGTVKNFLKTSIFLLSAFLCASC